MSSDKGTKSMWLRFFQEAGIPPGFDTKYALVFDENRIKKDMLMDINKECLRGFGITAMGDIIAILKHAKQVYEEFKAQAYDFPQPTSTVKVFAATSTLKSSSPSAGPSTSSLQGAGSVVQLTGTTLAEGLGEEVSGMQEKHFNETECIQMLTRSLDVILKDTYNNAFRQEIFNLLGVQSSDDAATQFKERLTKICAHNEDIEVVDLT